jgi:hypothetical protein
MEVPTKKNTYVGTLMTVGGYGLIVTSKTAVNYSLKHLIFRFVVSKIGIMFSRLYFVT